MLPKIAANSRFLPVGGTGISPPFWDNHGKWFFTFVPAMSRLALILSVTVFPPLVLFGSFVVWGQRPEPPAQPDQEIRTIDASPTRQPLRVQRIRGVQRIREGTGFKDMHVFFRQTGDRTAMYTVEDNQRFLCLENLTLERILTAIQEKQERQFWKIEGEFTEFRGENFVLIRRAVVALPPAAAP